MDIAIKVIKVIFVLLLAIIIAVYLESIVMYFSSINPLFLIVIVLILIFVAIMKIESKMK